VVVSDFLPAAIGLLVDRDGESPMMPLIRSTAARTAKTFRALRGESSGPLRRAGQYAGEAVPPVRLALG
jgi:hypothetical protein